MPQGAVSPSNAILCSGTPTITEVEIKTATYCYPGRIVIRDTSDGNVKIGTQACTDALGVLDVEPNELRTTIYGAGDQARLLSGPCEVLIEGCSGAVITAGLTVMCATGGTCIQGTTAGAIVGVAKTSASPSGSAADYGSGTYIRVQLLR